jgi:hypothetical protein
MTFGFVGVVFVLAAIPSRASDGVIEINQVAALAGGITSGDSPGFPVTISASGSYVLTGNLDVSSLNTSAIVVNADKVAIDLNGFTIRGPVVCLASNRYGSTLSCSPSSTSGAAVYATGATPIEDLRISNGFVRGFAYGVYGPRDCRIDHLVVASNSIAGLYLGRGCRIEKNIVMQNGGNGIDTDRASEVVENVALGNGSTGIRSRAAFAIVQANVSRKNGQHGIVTGGASGLISNNASTLNVLSGIWTGPNSQILGNAVGVNGEYQLRPGATSGYLNNLLYRSGSATLPNVESGVYMDPNSCDGTIGSETACTTP